MMIKNVGYLLLLCVFLFGCQSGTTDKKDQTSSEINFDSEEFSEKFNSYIGVSNYYTAEDKGSSWQRMLTQLDTEIKNGVKIDDLHLGNFMWGIDKSVKVAISNAEKNPNLGEVDKKVVNFGNELVAASTVLQQLEAYYKGKNYLDDNYTNADKLIAQFNIKRKRLDSLYIDMRKSIGEIKDKRDDFFIVNTKKEGKMIRYHMMQSMRYTREAFRLIDEGKFDKDYKANYDLLATSVNELQLMAVDDKALQKSNIDLKSTFGNYLNYLTSIKGNLRMLMDPKLDKTKASEILEELDSDFGNMVDDYNRI